MAAYLGEIRLFALPFVPNGWVPCNGALYDNLLYPGLANLLKNAFGGEPGLTFAVPDLRGRVAIGVGNDAFGFGYQFAQTGGQTSVQLLATQIPSHSHDLAMSGAAGTLASPGNAAKCYLAGASAPPKLATGAANVFVSGRVPTVTINANTVQTSSGGGAHDNVQPSIGMQYCMATTGLWPKASG